MSTPPPDDLAQARAALATQKRLSLQYGLGALLLALAGLILDWAWMALGVWAIFALWLVLRLRAAKARLKGLE